MFYSSKCCFDASLCRTRCEFGIAIMLRSSKVKNAIEKCKKSGKSCFAVGKEWVNCKKIYRHTKLACSQLQLKI